MEQRAVLVRGAITADRPANATGLDPVRSPMLESLIKLYGMNEETDEMNASGLVYVKSCLLYTSPGPRDLSTSRMPSSA